MKQPLPKMSALVVSAIRSLREARGSTTKDIMNYIMAEHHAGDAAIQRQLNAALKRGLDFGILKRVNGHYTLNGDPLSVNPYMLTPEDRSRRKTRRRRRGGRMGQKRKARRGRRGRTGRRRTRKVALKPKRRSTLARNREFTARRVGRVNNKEPTDKPAKQIAPTERDRTNPDMAEHRPADVEVPSRRSSSKVKDRSRSRSRRSQSQPRQPSRQGTPARSPSRSSASSDREDHDDNQQDD